MRILASSKQRPKQRIVMKFGGTSMAGTERIRRVANIVRAQAAANADGVESEVAVVVSAMAGETDRLVNFCREANALHDPAEYDVVVSSGEQVTSGLLALTLQVFGLQGAQLARLAIAGQDGGGAFQSPRRHDRRA